MAHHHLPAAAILVLACFGACNVCLAEEAGAETSATAPTPAPGSLYERLGGTAKIAAVVNDALDRVASDKRLSRSFDKVDLKRVNAMLVEQICSISGGGCADDTTEDADGGQQITNAQFYQLVEALRVSMRGYDIPMSARNELLAMLAPVKREVVER